MTQHNAYETRKAGDWSHAFDRCILTYDARFLRRKVVKTETGAALLVDLEKTTSLMDGDAFLLDDGRLIAVVAAPEPLLEITAPDLTRLAWHIGNRHTPCQIEQTRLLIQNDPVMARMVAQLGATARVVVEPFTPEGGAYGMGRTHGHDHGATHGPTDDHDHHHHHHDH